jgi:tRNA threonylcarbamoyladenosine biosynthesis protein TsaB
LNNRTIHTSDPDRGWLLAIDTSTEQIGVALTDGATMIELSLPGGRQQTTSLLPLIEWVVSRQQLAISDIRAVAVAIGPGSFTGLRVGLSIAKGLTLAQDSAVIGIPTLDIVAWPYRQSRTPLIAVIPAGRSRFVWCIVDADGTITEPANSSLDEFLTVAQDHPNHLVTGELAGPVHDALVAQATRVESQLLGTRRTAALADLGWSRWRQGDVDDPASLEPIYLHGKQTALPPRSQR